MAIRLRKIETSKPTAAKISRELDRKSVLWMRIRKLTMFLLFCTAALFIYYLYYADVSGIAYVKGEIFDIKAPCAAKIEWVIKSSDMKHVEMGEKLIVLNEMSGNVIEDGRRLSGKRIELSKITESIKDIETRIADADKLQALDKIRYANAVKLAAAALARGGNKTVKAEKIWKARSEELARAKRLWNLDALTKGDLSAAERMYADADEEYKNALLYEKSLREEYSSASLSLKTFEKLASGKGLKLRELLNEAEKHKNALSADIKHLEEVITGKSREDIIIKSPVSGVLMPGDIDAGEYLSKDEILLSVYQPETVEIVAYVPEKYKNRVSVGQKAIIKIGGRIYNAEVKDIQPRIVNAPPPLRIRGLAPVNAFYFGVYLKIHSGSYIQDLFPGQTGKVIFE